MMGFYVTGELFGILKVLMKLRGSSRMANGVSRGMNAAILDRRAVRESVLGMTSGAPSTTMADTSALCRKEEAFWQFAKPPSDLFG